MPWKERLLKGVGTPYKRLSRTLFMPPDIRTYDNMDYSISNVDSTVLWYEKSPKTAKTKIEIFTLQEQGLGLQEVHALSVYFSNPDENPFLDWLDLTNLHLFLASQTH